MIIVNLLLTMKTFENKYIERFFYDLTIYEIILI